MQGTWTRLCQRTKLFPDCKIAREMIFIHHKTPFCTLTRIHRFLTITWYKILFIPQAHFHVTIDGDNGGHVCYYNIDTFITLALV